MDRSIGDRSIFIRRVGAGRLAGSADPTPGPSPSGERRWRGEPQQDMVDLLAAAITRWMREQGKKETA